VVVAALGANCLAVYWIQQSWRVALVNSVGMAPLFMLIALGFSADWLYQPGTSRDEPGTHSQRHVYTTRVLLALAAAVVWRAIIDSRLGQWAGPSR
jgi:hypothetical protein